jgi:hypothetical protein
MEPSIRLHKAILQMPPNRREMQDNGFHVCKGNVTAVLQRAFARPTISQDNFKA